MRRATVLLTAVVAAIVLVSGMALSQTASESPTYTIRSLGTLPGGTLSFATDINDSGQIVGNSVEDSVELGTDFHAFLYSNGQMRDLGTLAGGTQSQSEATDINDSGQVVGSSTISSPTFQVHAYLYSGGQMKDLGTLPGGTDSSAYGINDAAQVVGVSGVSETNGGAFLYSGGQMKNLGTLGGRSSQAYDINDSGQVVGASDTSSDEGSHAFLYSNGQMRDLGHLGGNFSGALGINASGQVVGDSITSSGARRAFLYSNGQMRDLGTLPSGSDSTAYDINDSGEIVGSARTSSGADHAFVYSGGQMYDLNNLIPAGSGWVLEGAAGINTSGQIVGTGRINGQTRAFLASPDTSLIDTTPPKVKSTLPKANAEEVAPTANVRATFSEEMKASTINGTTFKLFKKGTTTQIAAQVSYNADTYTAKLDPINNLKRGVAYKAVVTTWARDVAGNRLDQDGTTSGLQQMRWFFRVDD